MIRYKVGILADLFSKIDQPLEKNGETPQDQSSEGFIVGLVMAYVS